MTATRFLYFKRAISMLMPFGLVVLFAGGCASLQEIRAKESVGRAKAAYAQAKANPNIEIYASSQLAEAGKNLQAAEQAKDFGEMEQLGYLAEKKAKIALNIAEGKRVEKENEALSKEAANLLLQKRVLEANLAKREAEQARWAAKGEAATAEKAKKEAERSKSEAEARAREVEKARLESRAEAQKAEKARMEAEARARQAEQSKAEINLFFKELSELQGKMTERGIVLTIGDVLFAFGKAQLAAGAVRNMDKLAEFLGKHPERNVLIEGHTDNIGSDQFNLTLSQKRADAVKEVLSAKGVSTDRILTKGYGKKFPVAGNDTESGRQLNRRVEVLILNEGVNPKSMVR